MGHANPVSGGRSWGKHGPFVLEIASKPSVRHFKYRLARTYSQNLLVMGGIGCSTSGVGNGLEDAGVTWQTRELDMAKTSRGKPAGLALVPFSQKFIEQGAVAVDLVIGEGRIDRPGCRDSNVIDEVCKGGNKR